MFLLLSIIIFNVLIFVFNRKIAEVLNLFDKPDKLRKLHKHKVPLTGGIIILLNACLSLIFILGNKSYYEESIILKNNYDLIILFISIIIFFFCGVFR